MAKAMCGLQPIQNFPEFRLPDGYSAMTGYVSGESPGDPLQLGYYLYDPDGSEIGYFKALKGREGLWQVLNDNTKISLHHTYEAEGEPKIAPVDNGAKLVDDDGNIVAFYGMTESPFKEIHSPNLALGDMVKNLREVQNKCGSDAIPEVSPQLEKQRISLHPEYRMEWRVKSEPSQPMRWGFVLIDPDGLEIGFFTGEKYRDRMRQALEQHA